MKVQRTFEEKSYQKPIRARKKKKITFEEGKGKTVFSHIFGGKTLDALSMRERETRGTGRNNEMWKSLGFERMPRRAKLYPNPFWQKREDRGLEGGQKSRFTLSTGVNQGQEGKTWIG